jgi:hypothetical protein
MKSLLTDKAAALKPMAGVLFLGFGLRLYQAIARGIINPDGVHYIYQAHAIAAHDWSGLFGCDLPYVSIFPLLIAVAHSLLNDWIVAGLFVNVLFGSAVLIPLYAVLRRFLDSPRSVLTVLIFAMIPSFVSGTADLLRDPTFWFFLSMGMLMYVRQWDPGAAPQRYRYDLMLSGLFFLLAVWARIEGLAALAGSVIFLLIYKQDRKLERLLIFTAPFLVIIAIVGIIALMSHASIGRAIRADTVYDMFTQLGGDYNSLRANIGGLARQSAGHIGEFFRQIKGILWFVPLGLIFNNLLEGLFYLYALVYLAGFFGIHRRVRQDARIGYFLWLTLFGFVTLYVHLLQTWFIFHRFLAIVVFPGCLLFGFGVDNAMGYLQRKWQLRQTTVVVLLAAGLCLFALPKNLIPKERDKIVYRQIARTIAENKSPQQVARIAAVPSRGYEWVFFYAHRNYPTPLCSAALRGEIPHDYKDFMTYLKDAGIRYVLYESRTWPKDAFDLPASYDRQDLFLDGRWSTAGGDTLMLFERR